jgi:hypothetical protein
MSDNDGVGLSFEPTISYSVKDILSRVEGKLDAALIAVATKAEHADVAKLETRVRELERSEAARSQAGHRMADFRRFLIPTVISAIAALAYIAQVFHFQ